jgi:hypothetical protein
LLEEVFCFSYSRETQFFITLPNYPYYKAPNYYLLSTAYFTEANLHCNILILFIDAKLSNDRMRFEISSNDNLEEDDEYSTHKTKSTKDVQQWMSYACARTTDFLNMKTNGNSKL